MADPAASLEAGTEPIPVPVEGGLRGDSANLDLLRSFAVLFVLVSHLPVAIGLSARMGFHLGSLGLLGVVIFFVHTCLVLMLSLQRQITMHGKGHLVADFFIRRAFRIYPLSGLVVLACMGVILAAGSAAFLGPSNPGWGLTLSNLFLVQNLTGHESVPAPLWSLPFEIQMYLVLPALYLLVERAGRRAALQVGLLWLGSVAIVLVLWRTGHNYQLIKFFPCFLPGVLAFCLRGIRRRLVPALLFAYVLATAFAMSWAVNHGLTETATAWPICLVLGVLIPACRELKPLWLRWAGKTIAKYSYGIYLMHGICVHLAFELWKHKPPVLQWACFFGTLVPLVGAAYHFIEKPGIDLGRRLAARLEQRNSRTSPLTASMPGSET